MNVTQLIDAVGQFVFSRNKLNDDDRVNYLSYLNLANTDAYACLKNSHRNRQELKIYFGDSSYEADLPVNYIHKIYVGENILNYFKKSDGSFYKSNAAFYRFFNNKIQISKGITLPRETAPNINAGKSYITAEVRPLNKQLVEIVQNPDTETDVPIYPVEFHLGLIHGAVYYLYLSQYGFSDKIKYAADNWKKSLDSLSSYYQEDV